MSAVDRIRSRIDQNDYRIGSGLPVSAPVPLTVQEAEALCDLADRASEAAAYLREREREDYAAGRDSALSAEMHAAELEQKLARLDGEEQT